MNAMYPKDYKLRDIYLRRRGRPERLIAYNTYQVKNYNNYELAGFSEEAKRKYREEHWQQDLQNAFDAGRRMAETITKE